MPLLNEIVAAGIVHDASAIDDRPQPETAAVHEPGTAAMLPDGRLAAALARHQTAVAGPHGEAVGPLLLKSSRAEEFRPLAHPAGIVRVALLADQGLLGLQEARHAVQDDTWIELDHVGISLPDGFSPAESTRALLEELAFTVPTYVEVPRTGYERALDVLAEDGVEHAAYRCGGAEAAPTSGEVAGFVHGCVDRRVGFLVRCGLERAVIGTDPSGDTQHGLLNVLAATATALDGASTDDLVAVLEQQDATALLDTIASVPARDLRRAFHGAGSSDVAATLSSLEATGAL